MHNNVKGVEGDKTYDVIFVGTNDGRVLKLVNIGDEKSVATILVETILVFGNGQAVNNLMIYTPELDNDISERRSDMPFSSTSSSEARLIVVSQDEVKVLPLHYCSNRTTCRSCGKKI